MQVCSPQDVEVGKPGNVQPNRRTLIALSAVGGVLGLLTWRPIETLVVLATLTAIGVLLLAGVAILFRSFLDLRAD